MNSIKTWVASIALASTVVGGGLTIAAVGLPSLAGAQGNETTAKAPRTQAGDKAKGEILAHAKQLLAGVAEVIGITPEQLKTELKAGKSLAQVAEAHGVSADKLVEALLAKVQTRVAEAVASGKITAEQGQKILAGAAKRLPDMVQRTRGAGHPGKPAK